MDRKWKVVNEYPKLAKDKKTLLVRCWFPTSNVIVNVDMLKVSALADNFEMITLMAFLQMNFADVAYFDRNKTVQL